MTGQQGPQGKRGEKGDAGVSDVPGPQGPKGEKGEKGDRGEQGSAGKDAVSLDQIKEAVIETVVAVLNSDVSRQIVGAQIAAIRQELDVIDSLASQRPSLRPIYADMTSRIRNLIR